MGVSGAGPSMWELGPVRWLRRGGRAVARFRWGGHRADVYLDQRTRRTGYVVLEPQEEWAERLPTVELTGADLEPPTDQPVLVVLQAATRDPRVLAVWRALDAAVEAGEFAPGPARSGGWE